LRYQPHLGIRRGDRSQLFSSQPRHIVFNDAAPTNLKTKRFGRVEIDEQLESDLTARMIRADAGPYL
jgi:hypothetical protein